MDDTSLYNDLISLSNLDSSREAEIQVDVSQWVLKREERAFAVTARPSRKEKQSFLPKKKAGLRSAMLEVL